MLIVADTSPPNYLVLLDEIQVLPVLYQHVLIPESVRRELLRPLAPDVVRRWAADPRSWIEIRRPSRPLTDASPMLDIGERDAIALSLEVGVKLILIDEVSGRREATRRGLRKIGVLGVLKEAHLKGLLDFRQCSERLLKTNFRVDENIVRALMRELQLDS